VAGRDIFQIPAQQQAVDVTRQPGQPLNLKVLINSIIHPVRLVGTNNPQVVNFFIVQVRPLA